VNLSVAPGDVFWIEVRNIDSNPTANWASVNFGRLPRVANTANKTNIWTPGPITVHGLDPREVVYHRGYGSTMVYGRYTDTSDLDVVPTYLLQYEGGTFEGQPCYAAAAAGTRSMSYTARRDGQIDHLVVNSVSSSAVTLSVGGNTYSGSVQAGQNRLNVAAKPAVQAGQVVTVTVGTPSSFANPYMDAFLRDLTNGKLGNTPSTPDRRISAFPVSV
jgi:hypothetical protein